MLLCLDAGFIRAIPDIVADVACRALEVLYVDGTQRLAGPLGAPRAVAVEPDVPSARSAWDADCVAEVEAHLLRHLRALGVRHLPRGPLLAPRAARRDGNPAAEPWLSATEFDRFMRES
jgi:hypothetical protein